MLRVEDDLVLVDPWVDLRGGGPEVEAQRERFEAELRAEVGDGHPLQGAKATLVGRSSAKDDFLFRLGDGRWAVVHLTWQRPDRPPWPATKFFGTARDVEAALTAEE